MPEEFSETTDLYLRMLRKAQAVEDPRLVGMILERLRQPPSQLAVTDAGCVVITFPLTARQAVPRPEEPRFWPRVATVQVGCLVGFYALLVVGHSLFG